MKFSWVDPCQAPLIVAHRGSSAIAPENTVAAFRQAVADYVDAIELDVHLTRDGEIVVIHDNRLERTTNGSGFVRDRTLSEIRRMDAGSWFHRKFAGEKIPTLEEIFGKFQNKVGINIEIKTESLHHQRMFIVDKCVGLIESYGLANSVLVSSFHHTFIKRIKELNPQITIGLLCSRVQQLIMSPISLALSIGAKYLILGGSMISKRIIDNAHEKQLLVGEYAIDIERRARRAQRFGIDAVITNNPGRFKELLPKKNKPPMRGL